MFNLLSGKTKLSGSLAHISLKDAQASLGKPDVDNSILVGRLDGSTSWINQDTLAGALKNVLYVNKNGDDTNHGNSVASAKLTIRAALALATPGTSIVVSSGTYQESNPIKLPTDVTIVGQDNRSVIVIPENPKQDVFRLTSGTTIYGVSIANHKAPSYAFSIEPGSKILVVPLIKNCKVITGPFLNDGTLFVPNQTMQNTSIGLGSLPIINPTNVPNINKQVNETAAGGGVFIDGAAFDADSLIKLVTVEQLNIEAQGGIGVFVKNKATLQGTSITSEFCQTSFKTESGGVIVLNGCTTAYGLQGLVSDGYYQTPDITGASVTVSKYSTVRDVFINSTGSGYTTPPIVQIDPPTDPLGVQAIAIAELLDDKVVNIYMADEGSGYTAVPNVTIVGSHTTPATAIALLSTSSQIRVGNLTKTPIVGSVVFFQNDPTIHFVTSATIVSSNTSEISISPSLTFMLANTALDFYSGSVIIANSHTFTYSGSGVTYNALPSNGGIPIPATEIIEQSTGRIYYSSVSEAGIYKIGNLHQVNQITGDSTLSKAAEIAEAAALTHAQVAGKHRVVASASADYAATTKAGIELLISQTNPNIDPLLSLATEIASVGSDLVAIDTVYKNLDSIRSVANGVIAVRSAIAPDATSIIIDSSTTDVITQINTQVVGNLNIITPTGIPYSFQKILYQITSTNVQTLIWDAVFAGSSELPLPVATLGAGKTEYFGFLYNTTVAKWQLMAKLSGF